MFDENLSPIGIKIRQTVVYHEYVNEILYRSKLCYEGASIGVDPRGLLIIGESGVGKSRILELIEDEYPYSRNENGLHMPLMKLSALQSPTVKGLVTEMLSVLGDPGYDKGTEQVKTIRLRKLMKHSGVRLLMIDEFQHFVDQGNEKVQHHVADWLKLLVDYLKISPILAGTPKCQQVFETNTQLKRRFYRPVIMPALDWGNAHHRGLFLGILQALQKEIDEIELPDLCDPGVALKLNVVTGGLIGRVANALIEAANRAYINGDKRVTLNELMRAAENASYDVANAEQYASIDKYSNESKF